MPPPIAAINLQKETNLHNLAVIQGSQLQIKAFIFVGWFGSLAWLLRRRAKKLSVRDLVLPEWYLSSFSTSRCFLHTATICLRLRK